MELVVVPGCDATMDTLALTLLGGETETEGALDVDGESDREGDALVPNDSDTVGDRDGVGLVPYVAVGVYEAVEVGEGGAGVAVAPPATTSDFWIWNRSTNAPAVFKYFTSSTPTLASMMMEPEFTLSVYAMYGLTRLLVSATPPLVPNTAYTHPPWGVRPGDFTYGPPVAFTAFPAVNVDEEP